MNVFKVIFPLILSLILSSNAAVAQNRTAKVGVLAFRGAEAARTRWTPLTDYLSAAIEGWDFELVPVTLVSAPDKITAKELDFLITNPGHYVTLAPQYGLSVLATRERRAPGELKGHLSYGTVIFTRNDSGILSLDNLKGKRLAAVSPDAFGGFQMAWLEMQNQNIDPFDDLESIRFMGFPQDAIVAAVLAGEVDAGVVRSGLLENLAAEGRLSLDHVTILQGNQQLEYPYLISGHLYPEWPFTALPGIPKALREAVVTALLATQDPQLSTSNRLNDIWSAPLSYEEVRKLTTAYGERHPQLAPTAITLRQIATILIAILTFFTLLWFLFALLQRRSLGGAKIEAPAPPPTAEEDAITSRFETLTRREREILSLICNGQPTKIIAADLGISPKTVEYHRANLLQKTDAGTTAHLVQLATRFGYDQGFSLGGTPQ